MSGFASGSSRCGSRLPEQFGSGCGHAGVGGRWNAGTSEKQHASHVPDLVGSRCGQVEARRPWGAQLGECASEWLGQWVSHVAGPGVGEVRK